MSNADGVFKFESVDAALDKYSYGTPWSEGPISSVSLWPTSALAGHGYDSRVAATCSCQNKNMVTLAVILMVIVTDRRLLHRTWDDILLSVCFVLVDNSGIHFFEEPW